MDKLFRMFGDMNQNEDTKESVATTHELEMQLFVSNKINKRESNQCIKLFDDESINIQTITHRNTLETKQYVMDMVGLLDQNGNKTKKTLVMTMAGISEFEAYIVDKQNQSKISAIYFKKRYDMNMKIKMMITMNKESGAMIINNLVNSITIHPNNRYIVICYDQIIKMFEIFINYKQSEIESIILGHDTNKHFQLISDAKADVGCKHFGQIIFLGDNDNEDMNELILIYNIQTHKILIYNFATKQLLYTLSDDDGKSYNNIDYNMETKYLTILKGDIIECYDVSKSTNSEFHLKLIFSFKNPVDKQKSNNINNDIRIISISPNGRYLLTSPRIVNETHDTDRRLDQPFDLYSINRDKLIHCDIINCTKALKRIKIVEHFGPSTDNKKNDDENNFLDGLIDDLQPFDMKEIKDIMKKNPDDNDKDDKNEEYKTIDDVEEVYDYHHYNDPIEYDSDESSTRYGDSASSYDYDHICFKWISNDIFIYIIDELNGHPHFGELVIVGLDIFELTNKHKSVMSQVVKEEYDIVVHDGIIEFICTFLNGVSRFKKLHIKDHGYRHNKKGIVCDRNNKVFGVYGWDRSLRFHCYS